MAVRHNARRTKREELGMRREELAAVTKVSVQTIFTLEKLRPADCLLGTAIAMAFRLGLTVEEWEALGHEPYTPKEN